MWLAITGAASKKVVAQHLNQFIPQCSIIKLNCQENLKAISRNQIASKSVVVFGGINHETFSIN